MNTTRFALAILLAFSAPAFPQATAPASRPATTRPAATPRLSDKLSVTEHQMTLDGQLLRYKATAGYLPVKDESGKEKANFFFVAYERQADQPASASARPITFIFNGGPGAAAVWLHLGAVGPKRLQLKDEAGAAPAPPYKLVDNEATWLDLTDLVFIDPVGTGYSRPAPGEKAEAFYGVKEDVASVSEFIRLYTTRYERWLSPKFLAGESYGTTRAAGLSDYLLSRYGVAVNGIVLMSSVLDFQTISPGRGNDLPYALYLPSYTAAAWYHQRLAADLQKDLDAALKQTTQFAMNDYLAALAQGDALPPDQRRTILEKLARLTSLPAPFIDKSNLRVGPTEFRKTLLEDKRMIVGRFDDRITGYDLSPVVPWAEFDPSFSAYFAIYSATFNDYVRRDLRYENDLNYEVLTDRVQPWNFGRAHMAAGYLNVTDDLRTAMAKLPGMKVLFASGYFDLATPYLTATYTIDHMNLSPTLRANISHTFYMGGHMMYHNHPDLLKLKADVRSFMRDSLRQQ